MGCKIEINKIYALFVVIMFLCAVMPMVLAATTKEVTITFNPTGSIDINVSPSSHNFSSVSAGAWATNTSGSTFTLYNNGTVAMSTSINASNSANMTLNADGTPGLNQYSVRLLSGLSQAPAWIPAATGTNHDSNLGSNANKGFDLGLKLGNISVQHGWQTFTITFTGSIYTP